MVTILLFFSLSAQAKDAGDAFFEKSVRPLLVAKCNGCHGGAAPAGGLSLLSREAVLKGGSRGPAAVVGKPAESLLVRVVRHAEGNLKMPPGPKLADAEIAALAQWVESGLVWGKVAGVSPAEKYWSFVAPKPQTPPAVRDAKWAKGPIDAFVLAQLEAKGLKPAPAADKRSLIRRATYDLTGLPPTPAEVTAFLGDDSPAAFARVVKRLLASPRYGERWGRHWLDVARYADSNGLDENLVYKNAWRYRDYVIAAFNKDKPYDQFLREQLAGDLLPSDDLALQIERWTATGFLSLGAKMLAEDDPVKMEMDIVDEQLDTVGKAFMGLTIGCARCHDHKFDPIPTADYYSLAGIFKSTKTMEHFKVVAEWHEHVLAPKEDRDKLAAHQDKLKAKDKEISKVVGEENKVLTTAAKGKVSAYLQAAYEARRGGKTALKAVGEGGVEREVSSFETGNVNRPVERKKTNVPAGGKGPYFAEYRVEVAKAGDYQIELLDEERGAGTADLYVGGVKVKAGEPPVQNREASPDVPGWAPLGIFTLQAGPNVVRFQHKSRYPYFAKVRVVESPLAAGVPAPRTMEQIATKFGVNPAFLGNVVEYLDQSNGSPSSVLWAFEHWGEERPAAEWTSPAAALFAGFRAGSLAELTGKYEALFAAAKDSKEPGYKPLQDLLTEKFGPFRAPEGAREYYSAAALAQLEKLEAEKKELEKATPEYPRAMGVREGKVDDLAIHVRGSHWTLGEKVPRRFLRAIAGENQSPVPAGASGRLELAQWLTAPGHPLTARVMANRLWRWHFGKGIVPTTDNFGRLGEKPTNQPLLDWLALRFVEKGWSMKALHEEMMLSATYQMSSAYDSRSYEADPENSYLWRFPRRRLEAESIRDAIMAVSGGLDLKVGGSLLTYKDRQYVANTSKRGGVDYDRNVRAVYVPVVRSSMYEVFTAFDLPDPAVPQGDRDATIVAPQALFMLNGSVVLKNSRLLAEKLLALPGDDEGRVREAYELALSRPASAAEVDQVLTFIGSIEKALPSEAKDRRVQAWQSFCKALIASNEFIYVN